MAGEQLSNGTIVEAQSSAPGVTPVTYIAVGGIQNIQIPAPDTEEIDVTALDSTGKETIPGMSDYGETSFTLYMRAVAGDLAVGQARLESLATSKTVVSFRITPPAAFGSKKYTTLGWVKKFQPTASTGEAYQAEVTIRWTGAPVIA